MRIFTHYTLAAATLAHIALSAIVAAPAKEENPFAVELPTGAAVNKALVSRDDDPLECDGVCAGAMHCCLIAGTHQRCHPLDTPCGALSWPDALSAPAPLPQPETTPTSTATAEGNTTVTTTLTRAATNITLPVESTTASLAAQKHIAPNHDEVAGAHNHIVTETTVEVVSETITTVVAATLSAVDAPATMPTTSSTSTRDSHHRGSIDTATITCWTTISIHSFHDLPAHTTVKPCGPVFPPGWTGTVDEWSTTYFYDPGTLSSSFASLPTTSASSTTSAENGTAATGSVLGTPWDTLITGSPLSTTSDAETSAQSTAQPSSEQSTITSVATVDSTTTTNTITSATASSSATESLEGEPSAIASSLGENENGARAGGCGWMCAGTDLIVVGAVAMMM